MKQTAPAILLWLMAAGGSGCTEPPEQGSSGPEPTAGFLTRVYEDETELYKIVEAEYNIYEDDGLRWLTLYLTTENLEKGKDPEPHFEANVVLGGLQIKVGRSFTIRSYSERLFNLAILFVWAHDPFDGKAQVWRVNEGSMGLDIVGESVGGQIAVRAVFRLNPDRRRSFT